MMRIEIPGARYDLDSVRVVSSGGESLGSDVPEWVADVFGDATVHEGYGQTEANMLVGECDSLAEKRDGSIGLAAPGHEVTIVDLESAEPTVSPGDVGEIAVRYENDPVCFREYWNEPEKTAEKRTDEWLLTSDLGTQDPDGYFTFVGRKDDVIICSGYRISPAEIEDTLAQHVAVADAGVIGVEDKERGSVPKAFVVLTEGAEPSSELVDELQELVRSSLGKFEYPRQVEFIDELPETSTGKIQRTALEER